MKFLRAAVVAAASLATVTALSAPAQAAPPVVGVNGCAAVSPGQYIAGQCRAVVTAGYYWLTVETSGDDGWANVGCSPSGAGGDASIWTTGFFYLPDGVCTVITWGGYSTIANLDKF